MRVAFIRKNIKPVLSTWQDDCSSFCQLWDHVFISLYLDSQPWHARENTLYLFSSSLQEIHSCFCYNQELLFFHLEWIKDWLVFFLEGRKVIWGCMRTIKEFFTLNYPATAFPAILLIITQLSKGEGSKRSHAIHWMPRVFFSCLGSYGRECIVLTQGKIDYTSRDPEK